jgi:hypothetical protein
MFQLRPSKSVLFPTLTSQSPPAGRSIPFSPNPGEGMKQGEFMALGSVNRIRLFAPVFAEGTMTEMPKIAKRQP